MFCAMATVIDRCKTEGVVDVFQAVKALRVQKPGAVPTLVRGHGIVSLYHECKLDCALCTYRITTRQYLMPSSCIWTPLTHTPTFRILCEEPAAVQL